MKSISIPILIAMIVSLLPGICLGGGIDWKSKVSPKLVESLDVNCSEDYLKLTLANYLRALQEIQDLREYHASKVDPSRAIEWLRKERPDIADRFRSAELKIASETVGPFASAVLFGPTDQEILFRFQSTIGHGRTQNNHTWEVGFHSNDLDTETKVVITDLIPHGEDEITVEIRFLGEIFTGTFSYKTE